MESGTNLRVSAFAGHAGEAPFSRMLRLLFITNQMQYIAWRQLIFQTNYDNLISRCFYVLLCVSLPSEMYFSSV